MSPGNETTGSCAISRHHTKIDPPYIVEPPVSYKVIIKLSFNLFSNLFFNKISIFFIRVHYVHEFNPCFKNANRKALFRCSSYVG